MHRECWEQWVHFSAGRCLICRCLPSPVADPPVHLEPQLPFATSVWCQSLLVGIIFSYVLILLTLLRYSRREEPEL